MEALFELATLSFVLIHGSRYLIISFLFVVVFITK
jgi:hypothetical protein